MYNKSLNFAFCFNENYAQYAAVCIRSISIFHPNQQITIHIVTDYLSKKTVRRLNDAAKFNDNMMDINFHVVDNSSLNALPMGIWPVHAWYRILLPDLLSETIEKVLYLDCDTLVQHNLSELFDYDIHDKAFGAVEDPQSFDSSTYHRCSYPSQKKYICSGILLLNLTYWREHNLKSKLIKFALEHRDEVKFPDQDCLNMLCADSKVVLPLRYGVMDAFFLNASAFKAISATNLQDCLINPHIIHFAGCAPWIKELRPSLFSKEWDSVNHTLNFTAKVRYYSRGMSLVKMIVYKVLHPIHTFRKYANSFNKNKAKDMISHKTTQSE